MIYFAMLVSNNTLLNILVPETNKVLKEVLKEADIKTVLTQNKDLNLSNILKSLFTNINSDKSSNETILNLLKNTNLNKDLGSFNSNLQTLLKSLPNDKSTLPLKTFLQNFLVTIDKASNTNIKEQFTKSGVFLESKLAQQLTNPSQKNELSMLNDMKTLLLKTQTSLMEHLSKETNTNENLKQIDKLLTQIDYHQLYSLANSSNNIYVPFLWDLLEDGSIDIKKSDDEKFYCVIDLTLKELGEIDIHLYMFNKQNIDISIFVEKDETKQLIREKLTSLKQTLFSNDLKVETINIYSKKEDENLDKQNVYKQNSNFDFGLNIKV